MHRTKIEHLLDFLKEDPHDSFTKYALALEYEKEGELTLAAEYYDNLLAEHPTYLATYYHAGKFFEKTDKTKAEQLYKKGMEVAKVQGNTKTHNELMNALNLLLDEW